MYVRTVCMCVTALVFVTCTVTASLPHTYVPSGDELGTALGREEECADSNPAV